MKFLKMDDKTWRRVINIANRIELDYGHGTLITNSLILRYAAKMDPQHPVLPILRGMRHELSPHGVDIFESAIDYRRVWLDALSAKLKAIPALPSFELSA